MLAEVSVYIVLALVLYYFTNTELADVTCPQGPNTKDRSLCREGNGKSYNGSAPKSKDTTASLLKKIDIAATAERRDVVWRRCYIIACACLILLFTLALGRWPSASEAVLTVLIIMTVSYFAHNFYNYHHNSHPEKNILDSTALLQERIRKSSPRPERISRVL
jgi:hypothetical protein